MSQLFASGGQSIGVSASTSVLPMNTHPKGLISFRMDWFDLLAVQGTLKGLLQRHSWKISIFRAQLSLSSKSLQLCPTLCDHTDGSPPGSPVPGILQARTLEWVAISFSTVYTTAV